MTRHPIVGLSLAATLLASCAQNGEVENRAAPPAAKTQYEASADVVVSGTKWPRWGNATTNHVYTVSYTGHGAPLKAVLFDSQYDNNMGSLELQILAR